MTRKLRFLGLGAVVALAIGVLLAVTLFYFARTRAFQDYLRGQVVTALERESGGRVTLQRFSFDLFSRTTRLEGLVVYGMKRTGRKPPLLSVRSLRLKYRIASLFEHRLAIASLSAEAPEIDLTGSRGGTEKLPSILRKMFEVKIGDLDLHHGLIRLNQEEHHFDLHAENVAAFMHFSVPRSAYELRLSSSQVHMLSPCCRETAVELSSHVWLRQDSLEVNDLRLASAGLNIHAAGKVLHFAQPRANFTFESELDARYASNLLTSDVARSGDLSVAGTGTYTAADGFALSGKLLAHQVALRSGRAIVPAVNASSHFTLLHGRVSLDELSLHMLGGSFAGQATLSPGRVFELQGRLNRLNLRPVLTAVGNRPLPWNASVSGPFSMHLDAGREWQDLAFHGAFQLASVNANAPLSGLLAVAKDKNRPLQFGPSSLELARTQASFQGSWSHGIDLQLVSTNLQELESALMAVAHVPAFEGLPKLLPGGSARFRGALQGSPAAPGLAGDLALIRFDAGRQVWDRLNAKGMFTPESIRLSSFMLDGPAGHASGDGTAELLNGKLTSDSALSVHARISDVMLSDFVTRSLGLKVPFSGRLALGTLDFQGSLDHPSGRASVTLTNGAIERLRFARLQADVAITPATLRFSHGALNAIDGGFASFSGVYGRGRSWHDGQLSFALDSTAFPALAGSDARLDAHAKAVLELRAGSLRPLEANGRMVIHHLFPGQTDLGDVTANLVTKGQYLTASFGSKAREGKLTGDAEVELIPGSPVKGEIHLDQGRLALFTPLLPPKFQHSALPGGVLSGTARFEGSLEHLALLNADIDIDQLALTSQLPAAEQAPVSLRNEGPLQLRLSEGELQVKRLTLVGADTRIAIAGSVKCLEPRAVNLDVDGALDLEALRLLNPDLISQGKSFLKASLRGALSRPSVKGRWELKNAAFTMRDLPSSLSAVNGAVAFTSDRATIEHLTGESGGGFVQLGGFVSFGGTGPLVYHLDGRAENVRVRSASNVSVTANTDLHLAGSSIRSLLSGSVTISRVVFNPSTDVGNVLTGFAAAPLPANRKNFLSAIDLDVGIESAPNLQLNTAVGRDVEAEVDLRLRGTPDRPVLQGAVSVNQGDIRVFGSRYSINRGEVRFVNTSKIDPVLDLDLQTQARGITVDITIAGTLNRLNVTYRSDPPLQPRDIIALLTVGRTPQEASNTQNTQIVNDAAAYNSGVNTVLGQAVSPASSRLSKLFGITNIKIDPLVQGITNTPQARLTLEQQVSRAITVTYVTNLSQTSEQIFRLEWALNRNYSLVAVRDDNGEFGIDIQFKRRFK